MKTWTTNNLRVIDPEGRHVLSVMPIPAGEIVAQHIANLLTQSDAANTTTMTIGDSQDTVTAVLTGEYAGELAERIAALMKMAIGTPTKMIQNMPGSLEDFAQAFSDLDAAHDRMITRVVKLAKALEKLVQIQTNTANITATEVMNAVNEARKALQQ